jgi:hypothetical protein
VKVGVLLEGAKKQGAEEVRQWQKAEESYILGNFALLTKCHYSDPMRREGHVAHMPKKCIQSFGWKTCRKETTWLS